ncbi:MAG: alkaline phosphatase D family protein [Stenomitos rutilans HA7619-LM2]|jgi:alkaline phosphatase D|nr:alkaline phosphatase D family protein [Stenomitos rutilans HA7619-LM2]
MDRRSFLKYSLAAGVVVWAGREIPALLGLDQLEIDKLFAVEPVNAATNLFPQSVASGDPRSRGITLWTRLAAQASRQVRVAFEVSEDAGFGAIATLRGVAKTNKAKDYTVKISLDRNELKPSTTYYYRFLYDGTASQTGRFKTLPAPNADLDKVRFAYINCQDYTNGYYNAYRFLAGEDLDFIVFLGDYIYETVGDTSFQRGVRPIALPSGQPSASTLADYRFLYQTYNSDPDLQSIREKFAFITIWDDHEFANDCFKVNAPDQVPFRKPELRQTATKAWAEYTATSVPFEETEKPLEAIQIYRSFKVGKLLELVMTDERLYRNGPPCDDLTAQNQTYLSSRRTIVPDCPGRNAPDRTMLGLKQRQWFLKQITTSSRTWKIWGNEVTTMQLKVLSAFATQLLGSPTPDLFITLDQWDGYPVERSLLFKTLSEAGVKNFVTITGDLHTFIAGYQRVNFDSPTDPPIGVEFVVGSTTSSNFAEQNSPSGTPSVPIDILTQVLRGSNPHIQYFNSATHGYNLVEVTPEALTCTFKVVSDILKPGGTLSTLKAFRVPRDQVLIQDVTSV